MNLYTESPRLLVVQEFKPLILVLCAAIYLNFDSIRDAIKNIHFRVFVDRMLLLVNIQIVHIEKTTILLVH